MRVGVVCEGPSDYPAIAHFYQAALGAHGVEAEFVSLFPELDRTRPVGGWANVLLWLKKYPSVVRVQKYFSGGLFGGNLQQDQLDAIIVQMDADILGHPSFTSYVLEQFGMTPIAPEEPQDRAVEIKAVLTAALQMPAMCDADAKRHIIVSAVEATEAWCVAAFHPQPTGSETLRGQQLVDAFMHVLEASESKLPETSYATIDKNAERRDRYCRKHASGYARIVSDCPQFAAGLDELVSL